MRMDANCTRYLFLLTFVIVALSVIAGCLVFDHLMLQYGIGRGPRSLVCSSVTGILAGTVSLQMRIRAREQQQIHADRLAKIAEVNHHVRNALAVVAYYSTQTGNSYAKQVIEQAIDRISWTLREVLPKGWDLEDRVPEGLIRKAGSRSVDTLQS